MFTNAVSLAVAQTVNQTVNQGIAQAKSQFSANGQNGEQPQQVQQQGQGQFQQQGQFQGQQGYGQPQVQQQQQPQMQQPQMQQPQLYGRPQVQQPQVPYTPVQPVPLPPRTSVEQLPVQTTLYNQNQTAEQIQPVYIQAAGTSSVDTAPVPVVPSPAVANDPDAAPAAAPPSDSAPGPEVRTLKATYIPQAYSGGHIEVTESGEQKYIPKPAPDASKFAPPPIHKNRGQFDDASPKPVAASTVKPVTLSSSANAGRPIPLLPPRSNLAASLASSLTNGLVARLSVGLVSSQSTTEKKPDPKDVPAKPVKFTDIDITKFGPPPPRIYRAADEISAGTKKASHSPAAVTKSTGAQAPSIASPPLPPARHTESPQPKKAPPPKPVKKLAANPEPPLPVRVPEESMPSSPPPYSPASELVSVPESSVNFAEQIARLRSTKDEVKPVPIVVKPKSAPAKPAKPAKPVPIKPEKLKPVVASLLTPVDSAENSVGSEPPVNESIGSELEAIFSKSKPTLPAKAKPALPKKPFKVEADSPPVIENQSVSPTSLPERSATPPSLPQRHSETKVKPPVKPKPVKPTPIVQRSPSPKVAAKPPPPPSRVARASVSPAAAVASPPPPPPRNYQRTAAVLPVSGPPDLDLELSTGWFKNSSSPLVLPKALQGLDYSTTYLTSSRSTPAGTSSSHTREVTVRLKDLARVKYSINWKNDDLTTATSSASDFLPSPIASNKPSKQALIGYSQQYGEHVAAWCLHKEGEQVGSGECWDLAHDALLKGCGKHAFVSTYYHHGFPILSVSGSSNGPVFGNDPADEIRRGDVLQFKKATFKDRANGSTQMAGDPDHTSVVVDKIGERLIVAEQNVQGVRKVRKGEYVLGNITDGSVVVYRPVPVEWAETA